MSNRDCHGDWYEIDGERWYRCLWDGAIVPLANCVGAMCVNCKRQIEASYHGPVKTRQFIVTEAYYDGRWHGHSNVERPEETPQVQHRGDSNG